jgi:hypothetical protein
MRVLGFANGSDQNSFAGKGRLGKGAFVQRSDGLEEVGEEKKENAWLESGSAWMSKTKSERVCGGGCV